MQVLETAKAWVCSENSDPPVLRRWTLHARSLSVKETFDAWSGDSFHSWIDCEQLPVVAEMKHYSQCEEMRNDMKRRAKRPRTESYSANASLSKQCKRSTKPLDRSENPMNDWQEAPQTKSGAILKLTGRKFWGEEVWSKIMNVTQACTRTAKIYGRVRCIKCTYEPKTLWYFSMQRRVVNFLKFSLWNYPRPEYLKSGESYRDPAKTQ